MAHSPFPGMDPYLEDPALFPDLHERLIGIIAEKLSPHLAPKYVAELYTQILIEEDESDKAQGIVPDVTIARIKETAAIYSSAPVEPIQVQVPTSFPAHVTSIQIRKTENQDLVAVIEILSPVNKRPGQGREIFRNKRVRLFEARVHYIEIDLLRKYPRMPFQGVLPASDYLVAVFNGYHHPRCDAYPITLYQRLPILAVPLVRPDADVPLDLQDALVTAYERARYDLRINYRESPNPPLSTEQAEWASALIAKRS